MSPLVIGLGLGTLYLLLGKPKPKRRGVVPGTDIPLPPPPSQPPVEVPPSVPPSLGDLDRARVMAPDIEQDLIQNQYSYDRARLREFQRIVRVAIDGLYGPITAGALTHFLSHDAPAPLFAGASGNRTPVRYTPPSM